MHPVQDDFYNQDSRGAAPVPRPKSELTKNGRAIGIRLTQSMYQEWVKLGATAWLRKQLTKSMEGNHEQRKQDKSSL
jgi:hypothetical protein